MSSRQLRWDEYLRNLVLVSVLHYKGLFLSWQGSGYIARAFISPLLVVFFVSLFGKFASDPEAAQRYAIGMASRPSSRGCPTLRNRNGGLLHAIRNRRRAL